MLEFLGAAIAAPFRVCWKVFWFVLRAFIVMSFVLLGLQCIWNFLVGGR